MTDQQTIQSLKAVIEELRKQLAVSSQTITRLRTERDQYKKLAKERLDSINETYDRQNG